MTFGYLQKVIAILQGWRFTTTGNTVTPQLANPLGAKLFCNKVPILKMRLTPYKSYKTEQPACATWTKMPSQQASVCPCSIQSKEIDSTPNGKFGEGVILPTWPPHQCCSPFCKPPPQWQSPPACACPIPNFSYQIPSPH